MDEFISKKALLRLIGTMPSSPTTERENRLINAFVATVKNFPAADVREAKRGKWVNDHNGKYSASGDNFYCSICKDPALRAFGKPAKTNYCPNCGADMRISSTNCKNTVTTGEDREISNLRAWLKNGQENKTK